MKKRIIAVIMTLLLLSTLIACSKQPITSSEKRVSESVADDSVNTTSDESKVSDEEKTVSSDNSEINSTAEVIQPEEESTAEKNEKSPVKTESENSATENSSAPLQSKKDNAEETKKPVLSTEDKPILTEPTKDSDDTKMSESETEPPKPKEPEHDDENQETTVTKEPEPTFDINYWISYAKSYAQKVGLKLSPDAIYCWDNPIAAGSKCKYTERDIRDCLDWYAMNEDISEVWVWAESTGNNSYELYIGYA